MSASRAAYQELISTLQQIGDRFAGQEWGISGPDDEAEALRAVLHGLAIGLETQFEDDPARPVFREIVTPWRKLLGDNPDARYHDAPVSPAGVYRVRGRTAGAVYVSFTVEAGGDDGRMPLRTAGVINDTALDVGPDGRFELTLGGPPREDGWLPLPADASRITVRHYWEQAVSPAAPPVADLELSIELIDGAVPAAPAVPTVGSVATQIRRLATFLRARTVDLLPPPGSGEPPAFVSRIPTGSSRRRLPATTRSPRPTRTTAWRRTCSGRARRRSCGCGGRAAGTPAWRCGTGSCRRSTTCAAGPVSTGHRRAPDPTASRRWSWRTPTPACPTGSAPRAGRSGWCSGGSCSPRNRSTRSKPRW